jgi:hypothetical protein
VVNYQPSEASGGHTSCPVQKIGQRFHGTSLAFPSQVLKYGFLTIKGMTGGVKVEAPTGVTAAAAARQFVQRIGSTRVPVRWKFFGSLLGREKRGSGV